MENQQLIFTNKIGDALDAAVEALNPSKVFILVDVNTQSFVLPRLQQMSKAAANATVIMTKAGDINKNIDSLVAIWKRLSNEGATRNALLVNLGGGVVTDMGAFAAATFKRGMSIINMPTTLLGAVDAAVGGKTGINFNNIKNQIGVFRQAEVVIISTFFFNTLNQTELRSGYAEMIKHGLLESVDVFNKLIDSDVTDIDPEALLELLRESVLVKKKVVDSDPTEQGIRRALNLGHTVGHALETLALDRKMPIPHGYAVAQGLVTELVLSHMQLGFPTQTLHRYAGYVKENFGFVEFTCDDYPKMLAYMSQDKKNRDTEHINFTLLENVGKVKIDCTASIDEIKTALDITRDLLGH